MARFIDADALPVCNEYVDGDGEYVDIVYKRDLDAAPTINLARHARWEMNPKKPYREYKCSDCGSLRKYRTKYCAACGARMDTEPRPPDNYIGEQAVEYGAPFDEPVGGAK